MCYNNSFTVVLIIWEDNKYHTYMELNTFHATSLTIFIYNTWKTLYKEETWSEFQHVL